MEEVEDMLRKELAKHKFGIVSVVDVAKTLKKKLDKDINPYVILGACSPPHAYKAVNSLHDIGLLLPCNILL